MGAAGLSIPQKSLTNDMLTLHIGHRPLCAAVALMLAASALCAMPTRRYTIADGLANDQARMAVELPNGQMVVQVEDQFCVFDGARFHVLEYDRRRMVGVESFLNTHAYLDRDGRLWVRDYHHVHAYGTRSLRQLDAPALLARSEVGGEGLKNFFVDSDGQAWLHAANDSLYRYDWRGRARAVMKIKEKSAEGITATVCDVVQAGSRAVALLSTGQLVCVDLKSLRPLFTARVEAANRAYMLRGWPWNERQLLVRTAEGLAFYDLSLRRLLPFFSAGNVRDCQRDRNGHLWVFSTAAVYRLDKQQRLVETWADETLCADWQHGRVDRQGGLWLCTPGEGVVYRRPQDDFARPLPLQGGGREGVSVGRLLKAGGHVWAGTQGGLLKAGGPQGHDFQPLGGATDYVSVSNLNYTAADSTLWVCTHEGELHAYDLAARRTASYTPSNVPGLWGNIPFCLPLRGGSYLVSVRLNRLARFYPADRRLEILIDSFPQLLQYRNLVDACPIAHGYLIGSQNGFYTYDLRRDAPDFRRARRLNDNPWSDKCNCLLRAGDGGVWVGTQNGLLLWDERRDTLFRYGTAEGLPNACVLALAEDGEGRLWVSTAGGVTRLTFRPQTHTVDNAFTLTADDGLHAHAQRQERALCLTPDHVLLVGHSLGIDAVPLHRLRLPDTPPQVQALSLTTADSTFRPAAQLTLPFSRNAFSISLSALDYAHASHLRYRYRMDDDAPWTAVDRRGDNVELTFANLASGRYRLQVQASYDDASRWGKPYVLDLRVSPPWWRSWWMLALYGLAALALLALCATRYVRLRNRRLDAERQEKERQEHARLQEERLHIADMPAQDRLFLDQFNQLIDANLSNPDLNVEWICGQFAMSRTTLFRRLKAVAGVSANEYVRNRRLQHACRRLRSDDMATTTIAAVAYDCGFSSPGYFRTCFKEAFGMLPGEYMRQDIHKEPQG